MEVFLYEMRHFLKVGLQLFKMDISKNTHLNASLQSSLCLLMEKEYIKCISFSPWNLQPASALVEKYYVATALQ